ncbi:MAG TPA: roadblock/LC7 domain-containing protein [Thermoplasmata archaeon]|nr:roadblock/LC7 domain-containing protein [Thermoplasmata archaeon]
MELGDRDSSFLSPEETRGLDAVLLLRRTGTVLRSWARESVNLDVISVMSATLLGSVESIVQAMGCAAPKTLLVESEHCRMTATQLSSQAVLVLMAPATMAQGELRRAGRSIVTRLEREDIGARRIPAASLVPTAVALPKNLPTLEIRASRRINERTS